MENDSSAPNEKLLYDPLFETPPDTTIRDTPDGRFFGKAAVKKTAFVLVMLLFVGVSITLSFRSLSKDRFSYAETDGGVKLMEFIAGKTDSVLEVGPVFNEDGSVEPGKKVTAVNKFAVCCNEYTSFILIGKDVSEIPDTAFYSCSSLLAVIVEPGNAHFRSSSGVLYRLEGGKETEVMLYPAENYLYRAMLATGEAEPENASEADAFAKRAAEFKEKSRDWLEAQKENYPDKGSYSLTGEESAALLAALKYEITPGVRRVGEMAFAECETLFEAELPEGIKEFASMCFFKCRELRKLTLPGSTELIGSDAFSYCAKIPDIYVPAKVTSIGHHAFFSCDGVDEVKLACSEQAAPDTGEDWLPKKRRLFLHDVPVVYGAERSDG